MTREEILQKIVSEVKKYYVLGLSNTVLINNNTGAQISVEVTHQGEKGLREWVGKQCDLLSEEVQKENDQLHLEIESLERQLEKAYAKSKVIKNA